MAANAFASFVVTLAQKSSVPFVALPLIVKVGKNGETELRRVGKVIWIFSEVVWSLFAQSDESLNS